MTVIISIIILVALVSLFDFFTTRTWQQVTSNLRNEVVFEHRNRDYGAYVMRRDYNKRILLIMGGMLVGVGGFYAATVGFRTVEKSEIEAPEVIISEYLMDLSKEPEKIEKPEKNTNPPAQVQTQANLVPTITDEPEDKPIEIPNPDIAAGTQTQTGTPGDLFGNPTTPGTGGTGTLPPVEPPVESGPVIPDVDAQFPGGMPKMKPFLVENLVYPQVPLEMGIGGKCYLRFVVDTNGDISDVTIMRGVADCPECDREAKRVVKKMPRWIPGTKRGKPVDSYFNLPITFKPY